VDQDLSVLQLNASAAHLIDDPTSGLGVAGGRLVLGTRHAPKLRRLVRNALLPLGGGGSMVSLEQDDGVPMLALTVAPLRDGTAYGLPVVNAAIIFIQRLRPNVSTAFQERAKTMFDLTPKEASLAAALVSGRSLKQAAAERSVSIHTARTQLAQLFRKTGTTQQSQLVALMLGILPIINPSSEPE
jgi:DNA-binding CsgD family transcriptional regulator